MIGFERFIYFGLILFFLTAIAMAKQHHLAENIKTYSLQSFVLFLLNVLIIFDQNNLNLIFSAVVVLLVKVIAFPILLFYTIKKLHIRDYFENLVSAQIVFAFIGLVTLIAFMFFPHSAFKTLPSMTYHALPVALAGILIGLLLMINRSKTISQIIGFLVIENSVSIAVLLSSKELSMVLELGLVLDLLVGVLIMGVVSNKIKGGLEHIDVTKLKSLKGV